MSEELARLEILQLRKEEASDPVCPASLPAGGSFLSSVVQLVYHAVQQYARTLSTVQQYKLFRRVRFGIRVCSNRAAAKSSSSTPLCLHCKSGLQISALQDIWMWTPSQPCPGPCRSLWWTILPCLLADTLLIAWRFLRRLQASWLGHSFNTRSGTPSDPAAFLKLKLCSTCLTWYDGQWVAFPFYAAWECSGVLKGMSWVSLGQSYKRREWTVARRFSWYLATQCSSCYPQSHSQCAVWILVEVCTRFPLGLTVARSKNSSPHFRQLPQTAVDSGTPWCSFQQGQRRYRR